MPKRKGSESMDSTNQSCMKDPDYEPPRKKKSKKLKKHRKRADSGLDRTEKVLSPKKKKTSHSKKQFLQAESSDSDDSNTLALTQRNTQLNRKSNKGFNIDYDPDENLEVLIPSKSYSSQQLPSAIMHMDNPSLSNMNLINLKPSTWTRSHTPHAVAFNMASYNIDCYPYYKNRIKFPGYRPKLMDTPVSRLLTKADRTNKNDIFLSSDEDEGDEFVECSSNSVKLISPNELILEKTLIP